MESLPPPPIFTLRGHAVGVTALAHVEPALLISGDEAGNIILWDQVTFKRLHTYENVCDSKILSLKVIRLNINTVATDILVIQSRNDGLHLLRCDESFKCPLDKEATKIKPSYVIATFPTYDSLFSRGDSITISKNKAILAYPSSLGSHLVTIRFLGQDATTEISGSAVRSKLNKPQQATVFDIIIRQRHDAQEKYLLFVGYEDGLIATYSFCQSRTETVPELNITGLKIELVKIFDLGMTDFVSAFDITSSCADLVCGSATKDLRFIKLDENLNPNVFVTKLSKPGTSVISIRPDLKLVAVGGWDNTIRLFSLKSKRPLATFRNHTKQVSTILFVRCNRKDTASSPPEDKGGPASTTMSSFLVYCASLDGTISVFDVY